MIDDFKAPEHAFLSNMYPCLIRWEGLLFKCSEAAYMAAKCSDPAERQRFVGLDGYKAKRQGRMVVLRRDWNAVRVAIMGDILRLKFPSDMRDANSPLTDMLLRTGDEELVDGNTWGDTFWGVCNGVGQNTLGKLLMARRSELASAPY